MTLEQLKKICLEKIKEHPQLKTQIADTYRLAASETEDGESETHECELATSSIDEMIENLRSSRNNMKITLSKSQWEFIGKKAGWIKTAGGWGRFSKDLDDVLSVPVILGMRQKKNRDEIFVDIKKSPNYTKWIEEEGMGDEELKEFIFDTIQIYNATLNYK